MLVLMHGHDFDLRTWAVSGLERAASLSLAERALLAVFGDSQRSASEIVWKQHPSTPRFWSMSLNGWEVGESCINLISAPGRRGAHPSCRSQGIPLQ